MNAMILFLIAVAATFPGAIPFGIVNLTVFDVSRRRGRSVAMKIAHGASWVEVMFALIAILGGSFIGNATRNIPWLHTLAALVLSIAGFLFLLKNRMPHPNTTNRSNGFLKGAFLNLVGIQVLIYWIIAMTYLNSSWLPDPEPVMLLLFVPGIWLGEMAVLWAYTSLSKSKLSRSAFFRQ